MKDTGEQLMLFGTTAVLANVHDEHIEYLTQLSKSFLAELAFRPIAIDDIALSAQRPMGLQPNAIGAMVSKLAREGKITCVGYKRSSQKARHAGLQRVWIIGKDGNK